MSVSISFAVCPNCSRVEHLLLMSWLQVFDLPAPEFLSVGDSQFADCSLCYDVCDCIALEIKVVLCPCAAVCRIAAF